MTRLFGRKQPVTAVRQVELSQPLHPLDDVQQYSQVRVYVTAGGTLLGGIDIDNHHQPVSVWRLRQAIIEGLGLQLLAPGRHLRPELRWAIAMTTLARHYGLELPLVEPGQLAEQPLVWANGVTQLVQAYLPEGLQAERAEERLPVTVPVSVVVATLDRPDDLANCLASLVAQDSARPIEIIVVDNNPDSGLTPPVVARFPGVCLVTERRQGLAYARNAGFSASTGDIVLATDDDVIAPADWVERLVAPFARPDVMVVTGNVLPMELETPAQHYFELYGGLGRGFQRFEVNRHWFEAYRYRSVPTWELGATANAAFRATIFSHPHIGLMDESLGPGMPSGVGEDTYVFYKVLKAGYTIVYQADAYVWHKHRRTMKALRRQLYNYSKGGIAFHLTLWLKDGDWRGLVRILAELPYGYAWRLNEWVNGRNDYPPSMMLLEIAGNLAGFWALWPSWWRVKREGRSAPYVPVAQRAGYKTTTTSPHANRRLPHYAQRHLEKDER